MDNEFFSDLIKSVKEAGQIQRGEIEPAAVTIIHTSHAHDYVWDGINEDDRPATEAELKAAIAKSS